jgi:putative flippase GtrA
VNRHWQETSARWLKFNAVGGLGVAVQLGTLAFSIHVLGWSYLWATAIGVELALVHNFFWHERYTWRERTCGAQSWRAVARRLLAFHLGNGLVSLAGNLALMAWLTGKLGVSALVANVASVVVCSLVNFVIGDKLVFGAASEQPGEEEAAALAGMATAFCAETPGGAADLPPGRRLVSHPEKVALRERKEKQRGGGGEGEAKADVFPDEQRRERPQQIERQECRKHALELAARPGEIEADARQPI